MIGFPVSLAAVGIGTLFQVPAGSTNGTALPGTRPNEARGLRFYLASGDSMAFALVPLAQAAPTSAPLATPPILGPGVFDEAFPPSLTLYITVLTGAPAARWM